MMSKQKIYICPKNWLLRVTSALQILSRVFVHLKNKIAYLMPLLTLWGLISLIWSALMPDARSSSSTFCSLLPVIKASVWAKKLDRRIWKRVTLTKYISFHIFSTTFSWIKYWYKIFMEYEFLYKTYFYTSFFFISCLWISFCMSIGRWKFVYSFRIQHVTANKVCSTKSHHF